jgi:hypothetical protein
MTEKMLDPKADAAGMAAGATPLSAEELAKVSGGAWYDVFVEAAEDVADVFVAGANEVAGAAEDVADAVVGAAQFVAATAEDVANQIADGTVNLGLAIAQGVEIAYNEAALPLADIVENGFEALSDTFVDIFEPFGEAVGDVFTGDFAGAGDNFSESFGNAFDSLETLVEEAHALAGDAINAVADLTGEAANFVMTSIVAEGFEAVGFDSAADYSRGLGSFLDDTLDQAGDAAEIGLTSIGQAYGAFIEGAQNLPDFVGGLSTALSEVMQGDFDGAQNAIGESAENIRGILAEGLSQWGQGVGGITDVMQLATKTVGELGGDLAQGFVTLTADLLARTGGALGIPEAAELRAYGDMVNGIVQELQGTVAGQAGLFPGGKQLDLLGAAAESAALLIEGKPEEAGATFLREANVAQKAITGVTALYETGVGQDLVSAVQGFAPYAAEFADLVQAKVAAAGAAAAATVATAGQGLEEGAAAALSAIQTAQAGAQAGLEGIDLDDRPSFEEFKANTAFEIFGMKISQPNEIVQQNYDREIASLDYYSNLRAAEATVQLAGAASAVQDYLSTVTAAAPFDATAALQQALREARAELGAKYQPAGTEFAPVVQAAPVVEAPPVQTFDFGSLNTGWGGTPPPTSGWAGAPGGGLFGRRG